MKTIGNLIWGLLGGFWVAFGWFLVGCLWCVTIIEIPVGLQCFKFAKLVVWPFGKTIEYGKGTAAFLVNILWIIFGGFELAIASIGFGLVFCVSVIGIPFGLQMFKLAKLALFPFGAKVV